MVARHNIYLCSVIFAAGTIIKERGYVDGGRNAVCNEEATSFKAKSTCLKIRGLGTFYLCLKEYAV